MSSGYAVGIDFGTTNSVVAHGSVATASVLEVEPGQAVVPSTVSFTEDGALVGREAANQAVSNPERTVRSVKRSLGDEFATVPGVDDAEYSPEQVAALVFSKLTSGAAEALGGPVTNAVVTVPAYFGHRQREATRRAAEIAGLQVDRLLSEPTAACLSYGVGAAGGDTEETVLVYDLGGGTFDVSLVDVSDGVFDVVASKGDTRLGGDDWDDRLVSWFREQVDDPERTRDPATSARLQRAARRARHDLSDQESTTVALPFLPGGDDVGLDLTRERLDELTADLADRTIDICDELLQEANWNPWTIDRILLVGGATRMPQVRDAVYDFFGQVPSPDVDPDEVVATGAAIQANILHDDLVRGRADGGTDAVLVDVVPRTLGVETMVDGESGYFSPVLEAHTAIPAERTRRYRTVRDDQTSVAVRVYQGDSDLVADNEYLGSFVLSRLPEAPAGEVSIDVTFEVTEDGTLEVHAADDAVGRAADVTIDSAFEGPDGEIRRAREQLPEVR
jgi:molecular chaperone DnaK